MRIVLRSEKEETQEPNPESLVVLETMKLVQQKDDYSCGVACIAMVTGKPYDEVRALVSEHSIGLHPRDVDFLLGQLGVEYSRLMYPELCKCVPHIITVPSLNIVGGLHYVVADVSEGVLCVLDPQRGREGRKFYAYDRSDREGVQLTCFAEVVRIL